MMPPERMPRVRGITVPEALEALLGQDQRWWPPKACFLMAAYYGNVCQMKRIATRLDGERKEIPITVANTTFIGMNALHAVSSAVGMLPPYRYLVEEVRMDVRAPDDFGRTPLEHAVTRGHLAAVTYLLDHGADLHQQLSSGNGTLLHTAAEHGHFEIAKFLISRGAHVDEEADCGTPLALAARRGYCSTVKTLLEHNADPNKAREHPFCPLYLALINLSMSCVKLLIQAGADVKRLGLGPCGNLLATAVEKGLTEAIKWMLEAGANPNVPDTYCRMPIELAAEHGTREDVEILFPSTTPIPTIANWSIDGIIGHVQLEINQLEDDGFVKRMLPHLKRQGDEAFKKHDYLNASLFYTQALKIDHFDTEMLKRRDLCWLHITNEEKADDAETRCKMMFQRWLKAYFKQTSALMFQKDDFISKPPFVFSRPPPLGCSEISIINVCTKEVLTVSDLNYRDASCCHSADGWLLMLSQRSAMDAKAYLIKPRTGERIDLPAIPTGYVRETVFSTAYGIPDFIVCFNHESRYPSILIKSADVEEWKPFKYPTKTECGGFMYGAIIGGDVYYVDAMGKVMVFNILESNWRLVCAAGWGRGKVARGRQFFVAAEGDIIRVHCPPPCYEEFHFNKFDRHQGEWIPLTEDELQNTSWFLSCNMNGQFCFRLTGRVGKMVYLLSPNDETRGDRQKGPKRVLRPLPAIQHGNIYVHNLDTGLSECLLPEPSMMLTQHWVHSECF